MNTVPCNSIYIFCGLPKACFNAESGRPKAMSLSIHLSEDQITQRLHEIFPKLGGRPFHMFKQDKRKTLELTEARDARSLWELNYGGVIIVQQEITAVNNGHPQAQQQSQSSAN